MPETEIREAWVAALTYAAGITTRRNRNHIHNHIQGRYEKMKCLSIQLAGHEFVKAFPNKEKTMDKHPDWKGDGVAVWEHEFEEKNTGSR